VANTKGFCLWFTGLSGAGKSTIAEIVGPELERRGVLVDHLDGDVVRTNLSKGLYAKARAGILKEFTGISDPYEAPLDPEMSIETEGRSPADCAAEIISNLEKLGFLSPVAEEAVV
jgi:adenylylsulfate kinase-like enzyme